MDRSTGKDNLSMISKVYFRLFPVQVAIVAMGAVNSIVDGIIAGRFIDSKTVGVVGLYYTVIRILEAVGAVLLGGVSVLSGRSLGAGKVEKTRGICSLGFLLALFIGMVLSGISLGAPRTIAWLLGADEDLIGPLATYVMGYGIGIIPLLLAQQVAASLQLERKEKLTQAGVLVMIGCNVGLDILLVAILDMGVWGLALATSISNWAYFLVMVQHYFSPKAQLRPGFRVASWSDTPMLLRIGLPNAILLGCLAARSLVFNRVLLSNAGQDGLSALSAFNMVSALAVAVAIGGGAVVRMLSSVFMGEENREGILSLIRIAFTKVMILITVMGIVFMLASPFIARGFFPDPDSAVYKMARQLFVIYFLSLPLVFLNIVFANHFQAFGFSVISNIVSVVDGFLSVVIPALILTPVLGAFGAWLSFPIGLVLTTLCLVVLVIIRLRRKPAGLSDWLLLPEEFGNSERLILGIHDMEDVTETAAQVQAFCMEHGIGDRISMFAGLCLEEMAGNIVSHGFESNRKLNLVEVRVVIRPDEVVLRIKDGCVPFNPKEWYEMTGTSDPTSNIGIRLVFALAKEVIYQNLLGLNVLTIKLNV